ncbi:MAG: universal stress protein [Thermoanaerobacterales bacterium]|nr:universal stress protein [Bacillota bacterium]MDI6907112.1 universal stress protein [Thermoanaerobacterales bacterium]
MFKKIMVAYDGSEHARRAFAAGLNLAERYGATLDAVMVADLPDYAGTVGEVEDHKAQAQAFYEKSIEQVRWLARKSEVQVRTHLLFGHVGQILVRHAEEEKMDLVVVGARGLSRLQQLLMGSVSQFVSRHAPCAVLVVKEKPHQS